MSLGVWSLLVFPNSLLFFGAMHSLLPPTLLLKAEAGNVCLAGH